MIRPGADATALGIGGRVARAGRVLVQGEVGGRRVAEQRIETDVARIALLARDAARPIPTGIAPDVVAELHIGAGVLPAPYRCARGTGRDDGGLDLDVGRAGARAVDGDAAASVRLIGIEG